MPPTTVYLTPSAIPAGQTGIVATSPAHAAAIIRGDAPTPEPVRSSMPTAAEARAGAAAAARSRAMTSSIGGSIAFVNPNSLSGGRSNPGYIVARQEWSKAKKRAERDYDRFVSELQPDQRAAETKDEFLLKVRNEFASGPIAHFKPDMQTLFAQALLKPYTKGDEIRSEAAVSDMGADTALKYFKDAGIPDAQKAVDDARRTIAAKKVMAQFVEGDRIHVGDAVKTLGVKATYDNLRDTGWSAKDAKLAVSQVEDRIALEKQLTGQGLLDDKGNPDPVGMVQLYGRSLALDQLKTLGVEDPGRVVNSADRVVDAQKAVEPFVKDGQLDRAGLVEKFGIATASKYLRQAGYSRSTTLAMAKLEPTILLAAAKVQKAEAEAKVEGFFNATDKLAAKTLGIPATKVPVGIKTKMYDGLREVFSFGHVDTPWRNQADVAKSYDIEKEKLGAIYDGDSDKTTKLYQQGAYATHASYLQDYNMALEISKEKGAPTVGKNSYVLSNLGTREQYADAVLKSQPGLGALVLNWLPGEYFRPSRWKELDTWEKVVYPVLDVAIIVPVVGLGARVTAGGLKSTSVGARIAAAGGKPAIKQSLMQAGQAVQKGQLEVAAKSRMLKIIDQGLDDMVKRGASKDAIDLQKGAQYAARQDVIAAKLEMASLKGNLGKIQTLWADAKGVSSASVGSTLWKTATGVQRVSAKASKPAGFAVSGIIGGTTVYNWNRLNNAERAVGLTIAGAWQVVPKAKGLLESVFVPHKIPVKALAARGGALSEGGVPKVTVAATGATGKKTRAAVADAMRQLTEGTTSRVEVPMGKGKKLKVRTTGFQRTVGPTGIHASPSGEVFLKGGASYLERYLGKTSVRVGGTEGGLFTSYGLLHKFSHQSALGKKGGVPSGILVGVEKVAALPEAAAKKPTIQQIEKATMQLLNSERLSGKMIEGYKQYKGWMELENVAAFGTELKRVTNLRSRLAKKLHRNKGEYYTADKQGRIELVQMYIEGGRSTPYTLAELYKLKGNALRNTLEDLFYGLTLRRKSLLANDTKKLMGLFTKEELLARMNAAIKARAQAGKLPRARAQDLRSKIRAQVRRKYRPTASRAAIRAEIARVARAQGRTFSPRARLVRAFAGRKTAAGQRRPAEARAAREGARQPRAEGRRPAGGRALREGRAVDIRPARDGEPRPTRGRDDRPPRDRVPPPPDRPPRVPPPDRPPRDRVPPPPDRPPRVPPSRPTKRGRLPGSDRDEAKPETMAPRGQFTWNQGAFKVTVIPPSYTNKKATVAYERIDPKTKVSRVPKTTFKKLGGKVPASMKLGMGVVFATIKGGKQISFARTPRGRRRGRKRR